MSIIADYFRRLIISGFAAFAMLLIFFRFLHQLLRFSIDTELSFLCAAFFIFHASSLHYFAACFIFADAIFAYLSLIVMLSLMMI